MGNPKDLDPKNLTPRTRSMKSTSPNAAAHVDEPVCSFRPSVHGCSCMFGIRFVLKAVRQELRVMLLDRVVSKICP